MFGFLLSCGDNSTITEAPEDSGCIGGNHSVTLQWIAPTQNADGSSLTDLAGYIIYYGTQSDNLTETVHLDTPGISTYVIDSLDPDLVYFFTITAVNSQDVTSVRSNKLCK
ncbi:MAG: fibronectin type III domain-containing protein [Gammaproteobacteria bacterium]|nr:fibronectin type III domain-containing protein [Gammaproteobacteria bacterium]